MDSRRKNEQQQESSFLELFFTICENPFMNQELIQKILISYQPIRMWTLTILCALSGLVLGQDMGFPSRLMTFPGMVSYPVILEAVKDVSLE